MSDDQITDYMKNVFTNTLTRYSPIILAENKKSLFKKQLSDLVDKDPVLQEGLVLYFYILLMASAKVMELPEDFDDDPVELVMIFLASTVKLEDGFSEITDKVVEGFDLFAYTLYRNPPDWQVFLWQCLTAYKKDYDKGLHDHAKNVSPEVFEKTQKLILFEYYEMWRDISRRQSGKRH